MVARPDQRVVSTDSVELAVYELGGSGPVLLLGHATGYCATAWRPVAAALAGSFRCVAFDGRAHGASGSPAPEGFSWTILGDDVVAVLEGLDIDEPVFAAGHSAGATGIVLAAGNRPELFAGVWAFEPVLFPPTSGPPASGDSTNPMADAARRRRSEFASPAEARTHFAPRHPFVGFDDAALDGFLEGGLEPDGSGRWRLACSPDEEAHFYEMGGFEHTWDTPMRVPVDTIFATGDLPGSFGEPHALTLASRAPKGRAEVIRGVSHFGPLERPDRVALSISEAFGSSQTTQL